MSNGNCLGHRRSGLLLAAALALAALLIPSAASAQSLGTLYFSGTMTSQVESSPFSSGLTGGSMVLVNEPAIPARIASVECTPTCYAVASAQGAGAAYLSHPSGTFPRQSACEIPGGLPGQGWIADCYYRP